MSRLLPFPVSSTVILIVWLLLNQTVHPAHLLLGAALAVALPLATQRFLDVSTRPRAPAAVVRLVAIVLYDIVLSNIVVARLVLGPMDRLRPGFVRVPVDVTHPYAIALFASIITMTPGTVSAEVSESRREILVHVLDLEDADALVRAMKARYEAPLAEILG
jgi:multicomponent K+:H+ antiporter subunit E